MHYSQQSCKPVCMRNDSVLIMQEILPSRCWFFFFFLHSVVQWGLHLMGISSIFIASINIRATSPRQQSVTLVATSISSGKGWDGVMLAGFIWALIWAFIWALALCVAPTQLHMCPISRTQHMRFWSSGNFPAPQCDCKTQTSLDALQGSCSPPGRCKLVTCCQKVPSAARGAAKQASPPLLRSPLRISSASQPTPSWSPEICFTSWGHGQWEANCWAATGGGMEAVFGMRGWGRDVQHICGKVLCWGDVTQSRHGGTEWLLGFVLL